MSSAVKSPCVSVCYVNDDGYCEGCFRTSSEIAHWMQYSNEEKQQVVDASDQRRKDAGMVL